MFPACKKDKGCILGDLLRGRESNKYVISDEELDATLNEIVLANADFVAAAVMWPLVHLRKSNSNYDLVLQESKIFYQSQFSTETRIVL